MRSSVDPLSTLQRSTALDPEVGLEFPVRRRLGHHGEPGVRLLGDALAWFRASAFDRQDALELALCWLPGFAASEAPADDSARRLFVRHDATGRVFQVIPGRRGARLEQPWTRGLAPFLFSTALLHEGDELVVLRRDEAEQRLREVHPRFRLPLEAEWDHARSCCQVTFDRACEEWVADDWSDPRAQPPPHQPVRSPDPMGWGVLRCGDGGRRPEAWRRAAGVVRPVVSLWFGRSR